MTVERHQSVHGGEMDDGYARINTYTCILGRIIASAFKAQVNLPIARSLIQPKQAFVERAKSRAAISGIHATVSAVTIKRSECERADGLHRIERPENLIVMNW
ncbi:hypothetical protein AcV5_003190 [Taiwanofungus camphoratus]|nr:hypothetical protein AcV5_003190 [Antrodia cinnamomea]